MACESPIKDFYQNKSIFITGGTGFVGSVLIEKLLHSCDVKYIYVLIKAKNGMSPGERLSIFLSGEIFSRIQNKNPDALCKIKLIEGDLEKDGLGMCAEDIQILRDEVSVIFHVGASVNFSKSLQETIKVNVTGTRTIINFVNEMKHLLAFIYVSTAYSNSNRRVIDEKVYSLEQSSEVLYYTLDHLQDEVLQRNLIDNRANAYTYTKFLAENHVAFDIEKIPTAIVRPSLILSALKEPHPGYLLSFSGTNMGLAGAGKGAIRCWPSDPDIIVDIIPVDIVANLLIALAWDLNKRRISGKRDVKVFNICSGTRNPVKFGKFLSTSVKCSRKYFKGDSILPPSMLMIKSHFWYTIVSFLLHTLPAFIIDAFRCFPANKNSMLKLDRKRQQLAAALKFFCLNTFTFIDYNVHGLLHEMNDNDREVFDFDANNIDWEDYLDLNMMGIKKYLLKGSKK